MSSDEFAAIVVGAIVGVFIGAGITVLIYSSRITGIEDAAVKRGHAELVIKGREVVWQWKEPK